MSVDLEDGRYPDRTVRLTTNPSSTARSQRSAVWRLSDTASNSGVVDREATGSEAITEPVSELMVSLPARPPNQAVGESLGLPLSPLALAPGQ